MGFVFYPFENFRVEIPWPLNERCDHCYDKPPQQKHRAQLRIPLSHPSKDPFHLKLCLCCWISFAKYKALRLDPDRQHYLPDRAPKRKAHKDDVVDALSLAKRYLFLPPAIGWPGKSDPSDGNS